MELYVITSDKQTVDTHEKGESGGRRGGVMLERDKYLCIYHQVLGVPNELC